MAIEPMNGLSRKERDSLAIRQMVMRTFGDVVRSSGLPPMLALQYAAAGLGSVYREMADVHSAGHCPCGWMPEEEADLARLQAALAHEVQADDTIELATVPVAGHA